MLFVRQLVMCSVASLDNVCDLAIMQCVHVVSLHSLALNYYNPS